MVKTRRFPERSRFANVRTYIRVQTTVCMCVYICIVQGYLIVGIKNTTERRSRFLTRKIDGYLSSYADVLRRLFARDLYGLLLLLNNERVHDSGIRRAAGTYATNGIRRNNLVCFLRRMQR